MNYYQPGYCEYLPKTKSNTVEMWQIFIRQKSGWYYWLAIILDEDGVLTAYPNTKFRGSLSGPQWKATKAQVHRLVRLMFDKKLLIDERS